MKKYYYIFLAIFALGFSQMSFSQSCDTLRNYDPADDLYELSSTTPGNGAIWGHNLVNGGVDQVDAWGEQYNVVGPIEVRRITFVPWNVNDGGGSVSFNVHADNAGVPGVVMATETVNLADLNENTIEIIDFNTPASVNGNFWVTMQLSYAIPNDTIALLGTYNPGQGPNTTFMQVNGTWDPIDTYYTVNPNDKIRWRMDVLVSNAPDPVAEINFSNTAACIGGSFNVDGTPSANVDVYDWLLTDDPFTTVEDDDTGLNGVLTPNTSGFQHALYLIADGGCKTDVVGYLVDVYAPVTATVNTTTASCGNNNGEISVSGEAGGDGTYTYSIDGVNYQPGATFSNLAPNTYTVYVASNGDGCEYTEVVTVGNIPPETITVGANQTICEGDNVTLTASGNGNIEWFDGGGNSLGTGTTLSVSPTTTSTYDAVLTDGNGCTDTDQITVTVDAAPTVTASGDASICVGDNTTVSVTGSAASYTWDNGLGGGVSHSVSPATTTTYQVTGTGANSCTATDNVTITVNPVDDPAFTFNNYCVGAPNGPTNVATSGGTYAFNPAPGDGATINTSTGEISNGVLGTTYTVEYTTNGTCPASSTETVTVQSNDDASFTFNDFCAGDTPIPSNIATTGGTFAFATAPGDGATINASTGELSNFTVGTTYDVEYTTPAGVCQSSSTETVTVNALPTVSAGTDETICDGDQITLTASGASIYTWDNGLGTGATQPVSPTTTTTYMVTGEDANGCENTDNVTITVNPAISATETITPSSGNDGAIQLSVSGGDGTYTFAWDNGETTQDLSGLAPGDYTVIITDGNGCTYEETFTVESTVGIGENEIQTLSMYPNPTDASVTIVMNETSFTYEIMNTLGQIITTGNAQQEVQVNTATFDSGVYFVKVKANDYEKTLRLVVKH